MKRPSNSDGDGEAQGFMREPTSPPSLRSAAGGTVIQFPGVSAAASAGVQEDAGVSSASASSTFVSIGAVTHAVVLRLRGGFPKIRVERATEGDFAARSDDRSAAWGEEDQR